jgi:hypothetical protein
MAHSIQTFADRSQLFNDADLLAIMALTLEATGKKPPSPFLGGLADAWRRSLEGYGPGVIDFELDKWLDTPGRIQEFVVLLTALRDASAQYAATIPSDRLNMLVGISGVRFGDYKARFLREAITALLQLITPSRGNGG